jgi:RimJ/RimL family protein N-acetyltransferase
MPRQRRTALIPPTVETRQLRLRAPEPGDVDALFEIQRDAEAMRHTYVAPDRAATDRFLQRYAARFASDGFAPWTAVLEKTGFAFVRHVPELARDQFSIARTTWSGAGATI